MPEPKEQSTLIEKELLRFTFCGIIIASFFADLAAGKEVQRWLSPSGSQIATTVLALSAGLSFAYLLSVASRLKYKSPRQVDRFPLSAKVTRFCYDASVNVFGVYLLVLLTQYVADRLLHLKFTWILLPVYVVLSSIIYFVTRVAWALAQRLIEYYYDEVLH